MDARDLLVQRALASPAPKVVPGASGYFTAPTSDLDPSLFGYGSDRLLPAVRQWILATVGAFWERRYDGWRSWATVWIAGSAISHQWSADRGNGDLDILIGVNSERFREKNPRYNGWTDTDIATWLTDEFKSHLDPLTAQQQIGATTYEVTWYVNPGSADIRNINPYAAYDVSHDRWTVRPIELPADWDPRRDFPVEWWEHARNEAGQAKDILRRFRKLHTALRREPNAARRVNIATQLQQVVAEGARLFEDIHSGRRNAFAPGGGGYKDWYNFRWQVAKRFGWTPAIHELAALHVLARQDAQNATYGGLLVDSHQVVRTASLAAQHLDGITI